VLFNAGTRRPQMASCFTLEMEDDMELIGKTFTDILCLSKNAGGIGFTFSDCRASESYIVGTDGKAKGTPGLLGTFEEIMRYADQGGGKRKGAGASFLHVSHKDIWAWLDAASDEHDDIYYGVFLPDLFFQRLKIPGARWTVFCPKLGDVYYKMTGGRKLHQLWGSEFTSFYVKLEEIRDDELRIMEECEASGAPLPPGFYPVVSKSSVQYDVHELARHIVNVAMTKRNVYVVNSDLANALNMQQNVGPITTSNLCTEIYQVTRPMNGHTMEHPWVTVCNLSSVILPTYVNEDGAFDFDRLLDVMKYLQPAMDKIIDRSFYPTLGAKECNTKMRSIGIGIMGLSDALQRMDVIYASEEGTLVCQEIAEAIQYGATLASCEMAKKVGSYAFFPSSPYANGKFHHDLWAQRQGISVESLQSGRFDWNTLREDMVQYGLRNSNLTAYMPTASSAIIGGFNESMYGGYPHNIYDKQTNAGDLIIINRTMYQRLEKDDLYTKETLNQVRQHKGSLRFCGDAIPVHLKKLFATLYEQGGAWMIKNTAAMQPFVSQGISMSAHIRYDKKLAPEERRDKAEKDFLSFLVYAHEMGLVTLSYYPRSNNWTDANEFGVGEQDVGTELDEREVETYVPDIDKHGPCSGGACEA